MSRCTWILGVAATMSIASAGYAQERCSTCVDSIPGRIHVMPAVGLRFGVPQKASLALGLVAGKNYKERGHTQDFTVYAEPGLSAGRATLGYINGFGNMGSGWGVGATALRTWKDPVALHTNQTFLGGEVWVWPFFFVGPRVGAFRQMTGDTHGWYFTADFGFGL